MKLLCSVLGSVPGALEVLSEAVTACSLLFSHVSIQSWHMSQTWPLNQGFLSCSWWGRYWPLEYLELQMNAAKMNAAKGFRNETTAAKSWVQSLQ